MKKKKKQQQQNRPKFFLFRDFLIFFIEKIKRFPLENRFILCCLGYSVFGLLFLDKFI